MLWRGFESQARTQRRYLQKMILLTVVSMPRIVLGRCRSVEFEILFCSDLPIREFPQFFLYPVTPDSGTVTLLRSSGARGRVVAYLLTMFHNSPFRFRSFMSVFHTN
ncbi:hypothetical protein BDP27DRAFT_1311932 [Rhodocollybia butyracea]|uniref:Uncharacterized protein n=1 Tax=Rhodocollybia butyracea TaxID=206335 RepID=A0A9P5Q7X7_9AGAR|nr:hypothetical protein BDP27DRAFT_1311932 [Rhodocollybia butyracea]